MSDLLHDRIRAWGYCGPICADFFIFSAKPLDIVKVSSTISSSWQHYPTTLCFVLLVVRLGKALTTTQLALLIVL
jgi:hypothetical protein